MTSSQTPSRRGRGRGGRRGRIVTATGLLLAAAAAAATGGASAQEMLAAVSAPSASQQPLASSSAAASPSPSTSSGGNATSSASSSPGRVISTASAPLKRDFPVPEINSGILLVGPPDYRWFGGTYGSRCTQMVDRAAALKQSRVMITPTLFWVDDDFKSRTSVNSQGRVSYFCYDRHQRDPDAPPDPNDKTSCSPADAGGVDILRAGMAACFKHAVEKGLSISIAPHLDDGLGLGGWRNGLVFDPLARYGSFSYAEFMLYPLADALNAAIGPNTKVSFALQGEMSATVFYYPKSYLTLVPYIKNRVLAGKPASWASNIEVGLSTNLNKLCGCVLQDMVDPSRYVDEFPGAFEKVRGNFDLPAISALYDAADFIGISNYASFPNADFKVKDLESATWQFAFEAGFFGVDVKDLIFNKGKKLYWNEYGVGGGTTQDGKNKAVTAQQAAATPFFGMSGRYNRSRDPWTLFDPATPNPVRDYLRYFYGQTLNYASSRGRCEGCEYRVDGIFIWNDASWDIQGIYPESTVEGVGSYRDPAVVSMIEAHNARAMAGGPFEVLSVAVPPAGTAPYADGNVNVKPSQPAPSTPQVSTASAAVGGP